MTILQQAQPEDSASGGAGLVITTGFSLSPWGLSLVADTPKGITFLSLLSPGEESRALHEITQVWPRAAVVRDDLKIISLAERIFPPPSRNRETEDIHLYLKGSPFQLAVWKELLAIPSGATISYGELAARIGRPGAARAVGTAVSLNPVALLIPCHRVVRASGEMGNYRWGKELKMQILDSEKRTNPPSGNR
jgi:AraC family transcriptional regulator of adaptative response/methylated-DNA-[protein]-cysteine methyltransferase